MSEKIALITGASRGLGAAMAEALAATHHIVAVGRTTGALEELDDRIKAAGGQATLAPMDITKPEAMAQLCRSIHDRWGARRSLGRIRRSMRPPCRPPAPSTRATGTNPWPATSRPPAS